MKSVRFDIRCEGDIEAYITFSKERVLAKKETCVTLGVPTLAWPEMIIDMFQQDTWGMPPSDKVYMSVDFDVANEDLDLILDGDDLDEWEAKLAAMDDDELTFFIEDMLDEMDKKYPLRDSDEESDDDEDESPEGDNQ